MLDNLVAEPKSLVFFSINLLNFKVMKFINSNYRPNPSGRLGANVWSKNKFGNYEKMLTLPSQPMSDAQLDERANFSALSRLWGTLTDHQRTMWDNESSNFTFTKGGKSYMLPGFNFFVKCNMNLMDVEEAIVTTVPADMNVPTGFVDFQADITATPGAEDILVNFSPVIAADAKVKVWATSVIRPGRKPSVSKLRMIGVVDDTFVTGDSIKDLYIAKFGGLPGAGKKAFFAMEPVKTVNGLVNAKVFSTAYGTI